MTSIRTKQKIVAQEVLYEFPIPKGDQRIARVTDVNANNLHHVETEDGERFLVSMPTKFRNFIMIKRGSFLIIEPIVEGKKVKGEITHILYPEQIRYIDENGRWPERFSDAVTKRKREEANYLDEDLLPSSSDEEEEFEESDDDDEADCDQEREEKDKNGKHLIEDDGHIE